MTDLLADARPRRVLVRRLSLLLTAAAMLLALLPATSATADNTKRPPGHHKVHHHKAKAHHHKAKKHKLHKVKKHCKRKRNCRAKAPRHPVVPPLVLNYNYARSTSPLGGPWAVYTGNADPLFNAYRNASGSNKDLLSKSALQPRMRWFGSWVGPAGIGQNIREYIDQTQHGDPNVLVQMATFNLWPRSEANRGIALTPGEQATYRAWVDAAAAAIGSSRTAILVEPDLAVATNSPDMHQRFALAGYAVARFAQLPHTTIYLDGSAADWLPPQNAVQMLLESNVAEARGFALGATHYDDAGANVNYARTVAAGLAGRGVPDKHAIIDTADTGHAFTWNAFYSTYPNGQFDNAPTCTNAGQQVCWALGDRPAPVSDADVDAFMWFGRPWLDHQANPFSMQRALSLGSLAPW